QISGYDGAMLLKGTSEQSTLTPQQPIATQNIYDVRSALARTIVQTPGQVLSDLSYAYDGLGNLTSITDAIGTGSLEIRPFKFDPDRICAVVTPGTPIGPCQYRYDGAGNVQATGESGTFFLYDGMNRMTSAQAGAHQAAFTYDAMRAPATLTV